MAYFVREPARAASAVASAVSLPSLKNILPRPAFYFLMLGSMASIGAVGGTIQNLALYLSLDRKLPQVEIDTTLSIILAGSVIGRLTMGWLADRWAKKHVMFLIYVIVALSIPMLVYAPTTATLKICAFLFGIGLGGDYMIIPLMAAELYGVAILGRVMGIVLTADSVSESLVPMLVASMRDSDRQLHVGLPGARRPGGARRRGGRAAAAIGSAALIAEHGSHDSQRDAIADHVVTVIQSALITRNDPRHASDLQPRSDVLQSDGRVEAAVIRAIRAVQVICLAPETSQPRLALPLAVQQHLERVLHRARRRDRRRR